MTLLKKLYFVLGPALLFVFTLVGFMVYNFALNYSKHIYIDKVQSEVNTALVAAEYEQLALSLLVKDISSSLQFLRYIQTPTDYTSLHLLEKKVSRDLNQSHFHQFGQRNIYIIDPKFKLTLSTSHVDPFEDLKIPDNIYERVFDIYTSLLNQTEQSQQGFSYQSMNGKLRYAYVAFIDPYLPPQEQRANKSLNRYILIADGPLKQLSNLLIKYNNDDIEFSIKPSSKVENVKSTHFMIKSFEQKQNKDSIKVRMLSHHFLTQINIQEQIFKTEKTMLAQRIFLGGFATLLLFMLVMHLAVFFKVVVIICLLIKQLLFLDLGERHQQAHSF